MLSASASVRLAKVDVEGAELDVLASLSPILGQIQNLVEAITEGMFHASMKEKSMRRPHPIDLMCS